MRIGVSQQILTTGHDSPLRPRECEAIATPFKIENWSRVACNRQIEAHRTTSGTRSQIVSRQEPMKEIFEQQGFVKIPGFLSAAEVSNCLGELDRYISEIVPSLPAEHVFYEQRGDRSSLKQLQRMHEYDAWFGGLFAGKPVDLARELLGSEVTGQNMQYFNKPPGVGRPTPPHQDGYYFKLDPPEALTMWLALDEADEENGCVRYVRGSHLRGMRLHGLTGTLGFSQGMTDFGTEQDLADEVTATASPGDLLAHHALTIHRASDNRTADRPRRALGFIYYSIEARQNLAAAEEYREQLSLQQSGKI